MSSATSDVPRYSWYALAVLTAVYVLNFLDRTLIYILFTPIKKEMQFTDLQLALLGTTSFVIFYTLLGIPFGKLADHISRKKIIGTGLAIWSLFSGLTGFADGFWTIFFCRVMVGVGEATLGPAAISLLGDYFPPRMRATANSIYSSGIALGGGMAFFLGGWIGQTHGWRMAFYLLGFPGLLLAVLVFLLRERPRGATETVQTTRSTQPAAVLRSKPFWYLCFGYATFGLASNNLGTWVPTFFVRVHELSISTIGIAAGDSVACGRHSGDGFRRLALRSREAGAHGVHVDRGSGLGAVVDRIALYGQSDCADRHRTSCSMRRRSCGSGPQQRTWTELAGPHDRGLDVGDLFLDGEPSSGTESDRR